MTRMRSTLGLWAAPILAGFSFTTVVMISADAGKYRWADAAILSLAVAAVAILVAVQCSKYVSKEYDHRARWYGGLLISYHLGLVAMMLGLGFALGPLHVQASPAAPPVDGLHCSMGYLGRRICFLLLRETQLSDGLQLAVQQA